MNKQYLEDAKNEVVEAKETLENQMELELKAINVKYVDAINEKLIELRCIDNLIAKAPEEVEATLEEFEVVGEPLEEIEVAVAEVTAEVQ